MGSLSGLLSWLKVTLLPNSPVTDFSASTVPSDTGSFHQSIRVVCFHSSECHSCSPAKKLIITAWYKLWLHLKVASILTDDRNKLQGHKKSCNICGRRANMRNSSSEREEEKREATPWPESILILVNINRLGSVTSTHRHFTRTLLIKSHQRQKYKINNSTITNKKKLLKKFFLKTTEIIEFLFGYWRTVVLILCRASLFHQRSAPRRRQPLKCDTDSVMKSNGKRRWIWKEVYILYPWWFSKPGG